MEIEYLKSCLESARWNIKQNQEMLKEAWIRINYLEGREAYWIGKFIDASHGQPGQESRSEPWTVEEILRREG